METEAKKIHKNKLGKAWWNLLKLVRCYIAFEDRGNKCINYNYLMVLAIKNNVFTATTGCTGGGRC